MYEQVLEMFAELREEGLKSLKEERLERGSCLRRRRGDEMIDKL